MKKFLVSLFAAVCVLGCVCGLTACGDDPATGHTHDYVWVNNGDGTHKQHCNNDGCDAPDINAGSHVWGANDQCVCGAKKPAEGHTHDYKWVDNGDGTHKQHCANDGCNEPDINAGSHVWGADDKCVCGAVKPAEGHTHDYKWVDNGDGTHKQHCANDGCNAPDINAGSHVWGTDDKCVCGAVKPEHTHVWSKSWDNNETHHWHNCTAEGCTVTDVSKKDGYAEHDFTNGDCVCGKKPVYTQGLAYEFDDLGKVYTVTGLGDATDTDVIIPDYYEGRPVKYIGESAFEGTAITSVKFGKNITTVETIAFRDCTKLKSVEINSRCNTFYYSCFKNCTSLTRIELPSGGAHNQCLSGMFQGCTALEYADLGDTRILTSDFFNGCSSLKTVVADSLTSILGYDTTFAGCVSLSAFNISDEVEKVSASWFRDTKLITVSDNIQYVGAWAVGFADPEQAPATLTFRSGTTGIDAYSFANEKVTEIYIPSTLRHIYGQFGVSKNIEIIHLTDLEAYLRLETSESGIVSSLPPDTYRMYLNGTELTNLVIPASITEIPAGAFCNCLSIQTVSMHAGVTKIGENAFRNCKNLNHTEYKNGKYNGSIGGDMVLFGLIDKTATSFEFAPNTVMISESAFASSAIQSITVPESVTTIGTSAFSGCKSLTSVKLPSGLTEIAECMFAGCISLSDVTVPDSVTVVRGGAFSRCSALTKLPFGSNSKLEKIDNAYVFNAYNQTGAFAASGLQEISFPATLTYIGSYAFQKCYDFDELTIGSAVTNIGSYAFEDCKMTTLVVNGTSDTVISAYAFEDCTNLESADIKVRFIDSSAFSSCSALRDLTLREGLVQLGYRVFSFNHSLYTVTLPSTLKSIQKDAFSNCGKLVEVQNLSAVNITRDEVPSMRRLRTAAAESSAIFKEEDFVFFRDEEEGKTYLLLYEGKETVLTLPVLDGGYELFERVLSGCACTEVTVPAGITAIPDLAFYGCSSLTELHLPASVNSISATAFSSCNSLATIEIDEKNATYSVIDGILYNKGVTEILWVSPAVQGRVVIPETVSVIGEFVFDGFEEITEIVLKGTTDIGLGAFYGCTKLESVVLPKSLTLIDEWAFMDCTNLKAIYYTGTAEEWAKIEIFDDPLSDTATIYYFSEEEPQDGGNYWHYDENDNPVVWQSAN